MPTLRDRLELSNPADYI